MRSRRFAHAQSTRSRSRMVQRAALRCRVCEFLRGSRGQFPGSLKHHKMCCSFQHNVERNWSRPPPRGQSAKKMMYRRNSGSMIQLRARRQSASYRSDCRSPKRAFHMKRGVDGRTQRVTARPQRSRILAHYRPKGRGRNEVRCGTRTSSPSSRNGKGSRNVDGVEYC